MLPGLVYRAAAIGVALTLLAGCGIGPDTCSRPESDEPRDYRGGSVSGDTYMTSPWDGDLLHFPGGAYYKIFHQLRRRPASTAFYLSFERDGLTSASVAPAAGNQVEVKAIECDSITIVNGSCAEYWMLATASVGSNPCAADDAEGEERNERCIDDSQGYRWNGSACEEFFGCSCVGRDCACISDTLAECQQRFAHCQ